jgi:hypothetical protein
MGGQLHPLAPLLRGKNSVLIEQEAGRSLGSVWTFLRREKIACPCQELTPNRTAFSLVTPLSEREE